MPAAAMEVDRQATLAIEAAALRRHWHIKRDEASDDPFGGRNDRPRRIAFNMWRQPPIWEPEGTKFRPYNISTLIAFYIGKVFGTAFKRLRNAVRRSSKKQ